MFRDPLAAPSGDYMEGLSLDQKLAVEHGEGPALTLSGAGSGKTRVLVTRLVRLITDHHARPQEICNLTFSRQAADEMRDRAGVHLGHVADQVDLKTFHSLFLGFLRERPDVAHLRDDFTVLTPDAGLKLLREMMRDAGDDAAGDRDRLKKMFGMVTRLKDLGHTPETLFANETAVRGDLDREEDQMLFDAAAHWYLPYQARLRAENAADFADFLLWPTIAMEEDEDLRAHWADRYRYIQVDEYQDTNPLQERGLACLAAGHHNLFAVGDDDQAIYRFRGSDSQFILDFEQRWPNAEIYRIMTNWRSTPNILSGANALISNNPNRHDKAMVPPAGARPGAAVIIGQAESPRDEAAWAVEMCRQGLAEDWRDAFITYRANYMSRQLEEECIAANLSYRLIGDVGFYARQEIKDALAYLRWIDDTTDLASWRRIANVPTRGLGDRSMELIEAAAQRGYCGDLLAASVALADAGDLRADARDGVAQLREAHQAWAQETFGGCSLDQRLEDLLTRVGYYAWWRNSDDPKAEARIENLGELVEVAASTDGIQALLDRAARAETAQSDDAPLALMSVHGSKGKEADGVVCIGWEEGTFPSHHAVELADKGKTRSLHDERNLAYVGSTRARLYLYITWTEGRGSPGGPSRFLEEFSAGATVTKLDIPTLPGQDSPSTPKQRELMQMVVRSLTEVSTPSPDIIDSRRRLSLWIDRHMPAFRAARAGGGTVDSQEILQGTTGKR